MLISNLSALKVAAVVAPLMQPTPVTLFESNVGPTQDEVRAAALATTSTYDCARLDVEVDPDFNLRVEGRVSSSADLRMLQTNLEKVEGVKDVNSKSVEIWPQPICYALDFLENEELVRTAAVDGPKLKLNHDGETPKYTEGDNFHLLVTPSTQPGYLYVVYFNIEGALWSLLPGLGGKENNDLKRVVEIGVSDDAAPINGQTRLNIGPPLEYSMVMVLHSREPLLSEAEQSSLKQAKAYVDAVRANLEGKNAPLLSSYRVLRLQPKK